MEGFQSPAAGGVAVSTKGHVEGLAFIPAGPVGEFGGGVTDGTAYGFYVGTPEKFLVGIDGGGYLNLTSNAGGWRIDWAPWQGSGAAPCGFQGAGFDVPNVLTQASNLPTFKNFICPSRHKPSLQVK